MKFFPYKTFIVLVLFQVVLFVYLNTNLDSLANPYRIEERRSALKNWGETHTPESWATFKSEVKLLNEHLQKRAYIIAAVFLTIDGIVIYYFWRRGAKSAPVSLP